MTSTKPQRGFFELKHRGDEHEWKEAYFKEQHDPQDIEKWILSKITQESDNFAGIVRNKFRQLR